MTKIVAVIGRSGSGKTSTIEYMISNLSREGFSVGTIKHVHELDFTIDTRGKDTWRYGKAGAKVIAIIAPTEVDIIMKKSYSQISLDDIIKKLEEEGLDVIFLEGFHSLIAKRGDVSKIVTAKGEEDLGRIMEGTVPPILAITGMVAKLKPKLSGQVPIIDMHTERDKLTLLVKDYILR